MKAGATLSVALHRTSTEATLFQSSIRTPQSQIEFAGGTARGEGHWKRPVSIISAVWLAPVALTPPARKVAFVVDGATTTVMGAACLRNRSVRDGAHRLHAFPRARPEPERGGTDDGAHESRVEPGRHQPAPKPNASAERYTTNALPHASASM